MRSLLMILASTATLAWGTAHAHPVAHRHHLAHRITHHRSIRHRYTTRRVWHRRYARVYRRYTYRHTEISYGGRPREWCGWYMARKLGIGGALGRTLWRAAAWARMGLASAAHIGAVVVWPHHVGQIVGGSPGHWVINSGNDGHAVRTRERSLRGVIAIRDVSYGSQSYGRRRYAIR